MGHVTIIAEIGSSPAPSWDFAPWCAAAAAAGADAVKVQLFRADHFPAAERASKRPLEFPRDRLREYVQCAHAYGLTAGASVFDLDAVALAAEWCDWLKLAAREQRNIVLLAACLRTGKALYRSVSGGEFRPEGTTLYASQRYPTPTPLALYLLVLWVSYCKLKHLSSWGWSSHTRSALDCVLAVGQGASVIEKHLAIHPTDLEAGHSLGPQQFAAMCRAIRKGER